APARASSELEASIDKIFDEGASGDATGEPIPTLLFVTSSVSATPEREDKSPADSVTETSEPLVLRKDEFAPLKFFAYVRGMDHDQLFTEFNVGVARQISLSAEAELLKVRVGEIESLKAQLLLKDAEAAEAIRLRAEVFKFEATEKSLQCEVGVLRDHSATLEREKNKLSVKVTDLSASVKVRISTLEPLFSRFFYFYALILLQVKEKFDKLCADFFDMAVHLGKKFYLHLLSTISRRRWLLTHGMELAVVRCLNSTEYMSALGAAISKAVEKGMQEGLSAGITHGAEGRKLAYVAAYNPSAEADYLSALQRLQNVNFSLIAELKSNNYASVDTIMNLLRLNDALTERLGLTESQPHANQLMVPIRYSPDQRVVGASALSLSLDVSYSRVRKIRENIASHVSVLRGIFVPLSEPLSAAALEGAEGTSGSAHDNTKTLSVTFVSAGTIAPISTDDYEVAHADGQEVPGCGW
nr:hypothetical protein [Tanacetum cinerariifolium]